MKKLRYFTELSIALVIVGFSFEVSAKAGEYNPLFGCRSTYYDFSHSWTAFPTFGNGYWGVPAAYVRKDWAVTIYPSYLGEAPFSNIHMTPMFVQGSYSDLSDARNSFFQADGFRRIKINDDFWLLLVHIKSHPISYAVRPVTLLNSYTVDGSRMNRILHVGTFFVDTGSPNYQYDEYPKCNKDPFKSSHQASISKSTPLTVSASCVADGQPLIIDQPSYQMNYWVESTVPEKPGTEVLAGLAKMGIDKPCRMDMQFFNLPEWEDFLVSNMGISFQSSWRWVDSAQNTLPAGYFRANGNEALYYKSTPKTGTITEKETLSSSPRTGFCRVKVQSKWRSGVVYDDRQGCIIIDDDTVNVESNYQALVGSPLMPSVDYDALPGEKIYINEIVKEAGYKWKSPAQLKPANPVLSAVSEAPGQYSNDRIDAYCKASNSGFDEIGVLDQTGNLCQLVTLEQDMSASLEAGEKHYLIIKFSDFKLLSLPVVRATEPAPTNGTEPVPANPKEPKPADKKRVRVTHHHYDDFWDQVGLPLVRGATVMTVLFVGIVVALRISK